MAKAAKIGQNFLHDKNIAAKIINAFLPQPGPVLEIGAGPGILSAMLLEKIPAGDITLVEIDRFHKSSADFGGSDLSVPQGQHKSSADFGGSDLSVPQGQVAVIGNLPYHISKALVDWFIAQRAGISAAVLMLQKDFVDKLLSKPGGKKYNAQSVVFQLLFQARRCFNVSAGSFTPAPRIMSTVLAISPAPSPVPPASVEFYDFVKLCFSERRKTLWNNLAPHIEKNLLASMFGVCGLGQRIRAEQLPANLFHELFSGKLR
jgi:16S rRNA (adenine1518-N6/adenine1519-N6)-dimethyltransferase